MSSVEARGVRVRYNGFTAVDGVDLDVGAGEWVSLIGPNGSGKSSLLRALGATVRFEGVVRLGGTDIRSMPRREIGKLVAVVPQHPVLPDGVRALDYVVLGRTPHLGYLAVESASDLGLAMDALERLDAGTLAGRSLGTLSGGERQRVVLARAIAQDPGILLLDEPTAALDIGHGQQVLDLVDALRSESGIAVVSAVHDLTLAAQYADRLAFMDLGVVLAHGGPAQVLTPAVLERFAGARVSVMKGPNGDLVVVPHR